MDVLDRIREQVTSNAVVIYMKGTPDAPQCGFSARAVEALKKCEFPFAFVNVLADLQIMNNLPRYADWPTFPQIYVGGELIGGCDITVEMFESGDLKPMIAAATQKNTAA
ncbi:MAG: Grx4 family monothiol glutaredoxin [Thiotrichaceae bacterium]|nr:Grx4 family monothiol glutaredoxin [Thiotrichaceae bacterium]